MITNGTGTTTRRTFVIMEAAACHDYPHEFAINRAVDLIKLARDVGADAVKFQWLSSPERLVERRRALPYLDAYRALAFPREWLTVFQLAAEVVGLEFMCTIYLPEDIAVVAPYVRRFKVSSFESGDVYFVAMHADFPDKPVILSAGMGGARRAREAASQYVQVAERFSARHLDMLQHLSLLHCVSAYPCPDEQANLGALLSDFTRDVNFAGYSDHTRHPMTGALAVAAGARIVEFHARLRETREDNADFKVARTPEEAAVYVANIRQAEVLCGAGHLSQMPAEEPMTRYLRYRVASGR